MFSRSTPGTRSADTANRIVPRGSGSGDSPGSVNDVVESKIVIDQRRWPSIVCSSAPWTVAPATGVNENRPPAITMALGGGSQLVTATVADGFTPRSQLTVAGIGLPASSVADANMGDAVRSQRCTAH